MTTKKEVKKFLIGYNKDIEKELDQNILIAEATQELYNEGLIDFDFNYREDCCDSWLQCEYFSKKLNKVIIIDYDAPQSFETLDDFIDVLLRYNEEVKDLESRIIR